MSVDPRTQFIADFGSYLTSMGFQRMPARVLALLLACDEETLTARELSERLGVSPAAISGAVRYLGTLNIVTRTRHPGERHDRFGIGVDFWSSAMDAEQTAYVPLISMCERALRDVDFTDTARTRIEETRDFMQFMLREMPLLMEKWRSQAR